MDTTFTQEQVQQYINSKAHAWAPSTLRSELARLRKALPFLRATPIDSYQALQAECSPYSLKTLFIRLGELERATYGTDNYKQFMRSHANLFKNAYKPKKVAFTFKEALELLEQALTGTPELQAAKLMLSSGLRVHEALKYDGSGSVVGKGAKKRPVFSKTHDIVNGKTNYFRVYRKLAKIGLKPHDLRKLAATQLASSGEVTAADLLEVFGWSNIQTATNYLQPSKERELQEKVTRVLK